MGIYGDLFPGVEVPQPDRAELLHCVHKELEKRNLQRTDWYLEKIIQVGIECVAGTSCLDTRSFLYVRSICGR